jgi:hypothetical protein
MRRSHSHGADPYECAEQSSALDRHSCDTHHVPPPSGRVVSGDLSPLKTQYSVFWRRRFQLSTTRVGKLRGAQWYVIPRAFSTSM